MYEEKKLLQIFRVPWIPGLFYKLVETPILEFLYLLPGLFIVCPFVIFSFKPEVIHAHGLVAGFISVFWGKVFRVRTVISTHSIYNFHKKGLYSKFAQWIFKNASYSMGLSRQAVNEIKSLGLTSKQVGNFTYWIKLAKFKKISSAKEKLQLKGKFVVLFVGRLVPEKGVKELLQAAKIWKKGIALAIAGAGPLENEINSNSSKNVIYYGKISQDKLPLYYSAADLLIVPSTHEEGFGRVILEALACGTAVIGSNRGAIPEAMDETVGKLIKVTTKNIKKEVEMFYQNPEKLLSLSKNARSFAQKRYSEKNVETIIKKYK
jgi:glycosyltransferase involved in cell wall biosynthesis